MQFSTRFVRVTKSGLQSGQVNGKKKTIEAGEIGTEPSGLLAKKKKKIEIRYQVTRRIKLKTRGTFLKWFDSGEEGSNRGRTEVQLLVRPRYKKTFRYLSELSRLSTENEERCEAISRYIFQFDNCVEIRECKVHKTEEQLPRLHIQLHRHSTLDVQIPK